MKKIVVLITIFLSFSGLAVMASPQQTFAAEGNRVDVISPACNNPDAAEKPKICSDNQADASDNASPLFGKNGLVTKLVQILTIFIGVASVIVIIISGIMFITSGGNPENAARARRALIYSVVGIIIAIAAQSIISFVLSKV